MRERVSERARARARVCVYAIGRDTEGSGRGRVALAREGDRVRSLDVAGGGRGDCCLVLGMSSDTENTKTTHDLTTPVSPPLCHPTLPLLPLPFSLPSLSRRYFSLPFATLLSFVSLFALFFFPFSSLFHSLFHLTPRPRRHNVRRSRSSGKGDARPARRVMDIREFANARLIAPSNDYESPYYRGNDVSTDERLFFEDDAARLNSRQATSRWPIVQSSSRTTSNGGVFLNLSLRGDISISRR